MSIGRQDYTERKEARIDRLEGRAAAASSQASAAFKAAHDLAEVIPFGQPILVGHHSEKAHRATLAKIDRGMEKSFQLHEKSEHIQARADAARKNKAISGDDPEAVQKLKDKLDKLQKAQERDKAINAYYRKHGTMKGFEGISDEEAARADAELAEQDNSPYSTGKHMPVPAWCLSNRNAEINRIKKRLEQLQRVDEMEHTEITFDGGLILTNEEANRVQILFDEKPDEETRRKLKGYGFRWSPSEGAWQAQRTPQNLRRACQALGVSIPTQDTAAQAATPATPAEPDTPEEQTQPKHETPQEIEIAPGFTQTLLPLA